MNERDITREEIESLWERSIAPGMSIEMTLKPAPSEVEGPLSDEPAAAPPAAEKEATDLSSSLTVGDRIEVREQTVADVGKVKPPPQYELLDILGEGGMGTVFRARQTSVDRRIALKMLRPESADRRRDRDRFLSEAVATADLDHPNIIPVYDLGSNESGQFFYAMKEVRGTPWEEVLDGKPLQENLSILLRVADAVAFAHSRGIIHRDLKPDNVMLGDYGEVMLTDWGLAVSVTEEGKAARLEEGHTVGGTPSYMAPELAAGDIGLIGPCSDVYLLGAILFRIVTGRSPHSGDGVMECLRNAANNVIELPEEEAGRTREQELLDIARKAMDTEPDSRHGDVKTFQADVREYLDHAESITLAEHAATDLERAQRSGDYRDYARAQSGYEQALNLWAANERARTGLTDAQLAYANSAFERGDFDLAESLLDQGVATHRSLAKRIDTARRERDAHVRRVKTFKTVAGSSLVAVLVLGIGAFLWIRNEQQKTIVAELDALQAEKAARELEEQREKESAREWHLVFEEDFSDPDIENGLVITGGTWEVRGGELHVQCGTPTKVLLRSIPRERDVRITFDCRHESEFLNDVSCLLGFYQLKYGGFGNTRNCLFGPGVGRQENASPLVRYRQYHAEATRIGKRIIYEVNGKVVFDVEDDSIGNEAHLVDEHAEREMGLYGWETDTKYDNIRVFVLGPSLKDDLLDVADRQLAQENYVTARDLYQEVLQGAQADTRRERARIGYDRADGFMNLEPLRSIMEETLAGTRDRLTVGPYGVRLDLSGMDLTVLPSLHRIPVRHLDCHQNLRLSSLAPLRGLNLKTLAIPETGVKDLSPLRGMPLRELYLAGTPITNLAGVVEMQPHLTLLGLVDAGVDDLSPLRGMRLERLFCGRNRITDLSPLKGMPLKELGCSNNRITDLSPLRDMPLQHLECGANPIEDLSPLSGMSLKTLLFDQTLVSDLSPLAGMPLRVLNFNDCRAADLSPLKGMPLANLQCGGNGIADLSPLKGMSLLEFSCQDNLISNLEPIRGMPLAWVSVALNRIEDLSPLAQNPPSHIMCSHNPIRRLPDFGECGLDDIDCSGTQISDLRPLSALRLRQLSISGTQVRDLTPLTTTDLFILSADGIPLTEENMAVVKAQPLERLEIGLGSSAAPDLIRSIATLRAVNGHRPLHVLALADDLRRIENGETVDLARHAVRVGNFRWLAVPLLKRPDDAADLCRRHGYRLASPATHSKMEAMQSYLATVCSGRTHYTIGALLDRESGRWQWASGETWSDEMWSSGPHYNKAREYGWATVGTGDRTIAAHEPREKTPFIIEWDVGNGDEE